MRAAFSVLLVLLVFVGLVELQWLLYLRDLREKLAPYVGALQARPWNELREL